MRIPASRLVPSLVPGIAYEVRTADYQGFDRAMPYTDALALAVRGKVEGIVTPAGRVKYLRLLPECEQVPAPELEAATKEGNSTAVARTNLGVYRQEVESTCMDEYGIPTRIVIGHTYAFCMLRSAGL